MKLRKIRIAIIAEMDIAKAILETTQMTRELGFSKAEQSRVATAVSELAFVPPPQPHPMASVARQKQ